MDTLSEELTTLCILGNFAIFLSSVNFFLNYLFQKNLSGIPLVCQTVWIHIRPDLGPNGLQRLSADDKNRHWQGKSKGLLADYSGIIFFTSP